TSEVSFWFPEDGDPGGDVIYIGPEVYQSHTAQCEAPPCVFVMPHTTLPSATTISVSPYTTELEVGASQGGSFVVTTTTVTITVGQIVTSVVPVSNHNITRGETPGAPFYVTPSVTFSPMGVPVTKPNGVVTTRSVTLPPWPQIMSWPGGSSGGGQNPGPPGSGDVTSRTTRPGGTMGPPGTVTFPEAQPVEPSAYFFCPPERQFVEVGDYNAIITLSGCTAPTTLFWNCPATATVEIAEPTTVDFSLGCTRWTGTGTSEPIPTMTDYPPGAELEWVEEDGENDDDDDTSTCELWFFFICINWGRVKIGGWRWNFPGPVVITGPPPIKWPPGVTVKGNLPGPWPPVTIGRDGKPTLPPRQPTNCETQEAEICSTSTFISTTVIDGSTSTITASATTTCDTIRGCVLPDGDYDTTSRTGGQCAFNPAMRTAAPAVSAVPTEVVFTTATASPSASIEFAASPGENASRNVTERSSRVIQKRADEPPPAGRDHALIWLWSPENEDEVNTVIQHITDYNSAGESYTPKLVTAKDAWSGAADNAWDENAQRSDWTPLIVVPNMQLCHMEELLDNVPSMILDIYGIYDRNKNGPPPPPPDSDDDSDRLPSTGSPQTLRKDKRDIEDFYGMGWELSQIAIAPGDPWDIEWQPGSGGTGMPYFADSSFGAGQIVYILEDDILDSHVEFDDDWSDQFAPDTFYNRGPIVKIPEFDWGLPNSNGPANVEHGTGVASKAVGWYLGMAKRAQLVVVQDRSLEPADPNNKIWQRRLEIWVRVYNDVRRRYAQDPSVRGKIVISASFGYDDYLSNFPPLMIKRWRDIMKMLDRLDVVIVCAAHNQYQQLENTFPGVPDLFADPDEGTHLSSNMVLVGGTDAAGRIGAHSPYADWLVMAPGYSSFVADEQGIAPGVTGNSFAAPLVAGIVAYWRGLPNLANGWDVELRDPSNVKKLLMYMQRVIEPDNLPDYLRDNINSEISIPADFDTSNVREIASIWTGQVGKENCLQDPSIHQSCPQGRLADLLPHGAGCAQPGSGGNKIAARDGTVCVIRGGTGGGDGPGSGIGDPITYSPGPASPTCAPGSQGCGTLCTGFYCVPSPSGFPPDRWDPEDPAHRPTSRRSPTTRPTLPPLPTQTTSCAYPTPTTICNGSGGRQVCITSTACGPPLTLPPLPSQTSCASYKPTTICNGSGNQHVCETTSVCAETSGAYSGPGCRSYTSTRICNGSGDCVEDNICVPSHAPCAGWATIGSALCTDANYPYCLGTTSYVLCARPAKTDAVEARQATPATAEAVATEAPVPRYRRAQILQQEREQERERKQDEVMPQAARNDALSAPAGDNVGVLQAMVAKAAAVLADDVSINNSTSAVAEAALLVARQDNAWDCSGGCAAYPRCNLCAKVVNRVCVQAFVTVTMSAIDTDVKLDIIADGELACTTTLSCLTIDSSDCFGSGDVGEIDCGNGNKILAWGNGLSTVKFHSGKTPEQPYYLYLGQDGDDEWYPCDVSRRMIAICVDAMWSAWDGSCSGMSTREAALRKRVEIGAPRDLEFREPLGLGR
ncbi:glucan 1,3-beta-glucosidase, partial [Colletotrichum musicola]